MWKVYAAIAWAAQGALGLDLTGAWVALPAGATARERKAAVVLVEEVERRTGIRWPLASGPGPAVRLERGSGPAEGFRLRIDPTGVVISGNDERGVLFGVGRLLRELRMTPGSVGAPGALDVATAPRYRMRGHQLGYRPKTNSYDGWTVAMWEQYIRDLAVFGANAVELIPPRSDDDTDSPHFPLPPMRMMREMSRLLDEYGLDVGIWYPAMAADYTNPATVDAEIKEWGEVFRQLPRVDAVFVPGGDPGHTPPRVLMALLEKQARNLRRYHPKAQMWVSPQGFSQSWLDDFFAILRTEPEWLTGVVYGPQVKGSIEALRAAVPKRYPIRHYPDITHTRQCQFPVPEWDAAYSLTEAREPINPRPTQYARIFRLYQPHTIGFTTYSEGCNDDVNKVVWSALGWDPEADVTQVLREYSRYFLGPRYEDTFAQGLLALERNWEGPLATNEGVYTTLAQFQDMERQASPRDLLNWRFQQALYRAYYDAYTRRRLLYENELEQRAMDQLRAGGPAAIPEAERTLDRAVLSPAGAGWRARVFELGEALYQSIRMQLSVERYKAIAVGRGANLDTIDVPLNNGPWLKREFARKTPLDRILHWTDPGPGGFYDDLGDVTRQPHLVRGEGFDKDPAFLNSAMESVVQLPGARLSWMTFAQSLHESPLRMRYSGLDPAARYKLRVTYSGDAQKRRIRLTAGGIEVHGFIVKKDPPEPVEFAIPAAAVKDGELTLTWWQEPGLGGNGRGCQVAEVWLIRD
jgi:hypothetical protein